MEHEEEFRIQGRRTREELKELVVSKFLGEEPGEGKAKLASRHRYNVERLAEGRRIFLSRPAPLRWGFDFVVHVEGATFAKGRSNPSHQDILEDLEDKRQSLSPEAVGVIRECCSAVYEGHDPDDVLGSQQLPKGAGGFSLELILKVLKWLWIEQDIRYWNYSGRQMLKTAVDKALGGT